MKDRRRGHIELAEHGARDTVVKDPKSKLKFFLESLSISPSHLDKKSRTSRHDCIKAMFESKSVDEYNAHKKILKNLLFRNHGIWSDERNLWKDQQYKPNNRSDRKSNDLRGFGNGKENPQRNSGAVQTKDLQFSEYNMAAKKRQQRKFPTSSLADVSHSNEYSFMAEKSPTFTMTSSNNIAIRRTGCTLRRAQFDIYGDDAAVGAIFNKKVTTKQGPDPYSGSACRLFSTNGFKICGFFLENWTIYINCTLSHAAPGSENLKMIGSTEASGHYLGK
jgi:hypothetical protein